LRSQQCSIRALFLFIFQIDMVFVRNLVNARGVLALWVTTIALIGSALVCHCQTEWADCAGASALAI
jgi:hypothetical protein